MTGSGFGLPSYRFLFEQNACRGQLGCDARSSGRQRFAASLALPAGRSLSAGLSKGLTESGSDVSAFLAWSIPLSLTRSPSPNSPSPSQ